MYPMITIDRGQGSDPYRDDPLETKAHSEPTLCLNLRRMMNHEGYLLFQATTSSVLL